MEAMMTSNFIVRFTLGFCLCGTIAFALQSPEFVEHPTDVVAVAGKDITLICVVENLPVEDDLVQWTKDGFALGYDRAIPGFKSYSMVGDESIGEYNLLIRNAGLRDEAEYECQVRLDRMRTKARVTILAPPQGPMIDNERDDAINVLAYSMNFITCRSWSGKPAGKLSWTKDGVKVEQNVTYAESQDVGKTRNSSATLRIWPTEKDNGDSYHCLMMADKIFSETGETELVSTRTVRVNVQKLPVASLSTSRAETNEGGNLIARCEAFDSQPPVTSFKWYVGGKILHGEGDATLAILNVNRTWNGAVLGCRAVNNLGESNISTVTLNVLYAPVLVSTSQDVVTNFPAAVTLSCAWESNPPALVTWYKRGAHSTVIGDGEQLRIRVEDQSAAGVYVCVANAPRVATKSATVRVDVLGPPLFSSPSIQRTIVGGRAMLNCTLESTPGIAHIVWSFMRERSLVTLLNNETLYVAGKVKYAGVTVHGRQNASLIVHDVTTDDMIQYNCTARNLYGQGTTAIFLKGQTAEAMSAGIPMIAAVVGGVFLLLLVVLLVVFCVRRKRRRKPPTTLPDEKEKMRAEDAGAALQENTRPDLHPAVVKLISPDADSDNPSTSASVASRDVARDPLEDFRTFGHNDDGYHTEEANSWNRNEKQSPPSSPADGAREDYAPRAYATSTAHMMGSERAASPYAGSDMASDVAAPGYLRYNIQPRRPPHGHYPVHYAPDGVLEHPLAARAASPRSARQLQQPPPYYQGPSSSAHQGLLGYHQVEPHRARAGSNTPSIASSRRSVAPSPYPLGRATPTSVLSDRAMYSVPAAAQPRHARSASSQSSLEMVASSSSSAAAAAQDPYENPAQMSRLSSRLSQASRSQEALSKPLVARMATHV